MAEFVLKSVDEETGDMCDVYDSLVEPKRIWRNNNNKLYLALRSIGAGFVKLRDMVFALRNRFDPRYCEDSDLYSTAKLVGTVAKSGAGSLVEITVTNTSLEENKTLPSGIYDYMSVSGMTFSFELADPRLYTPGMTRKTFGVSQEKGEYRVSQNTRITVTRRDGESIDSAFSFSSADNAGRLGYPDEDSYAFRQRILNDADRQDHLKELELSIRNLANILECTLKLNDSLGTMVYDGITLAPFELLISVTGAPTAEMAKLVANDALYATHMSDPELVVYYQNDIYINGRYPVYFKYHDTYDFTLRLQYQYSSKNLKPEQIEAEISAALDKYQNMSTFMDVLTERILYDDIRTVQLPNVVILNIDILVNGVQVEYIDIPKTRLPRLMGIVYTAIDVEGT